MKGIRRSLNKDRIGTPTAVYSSLPTEGFPSIVPIIAAVPPPPPTRVIRAIHNYSAASRNELSFNEGDFFHVVSDDGGEDWFDAANPLTGARGLVPATHFQVLGRNARDKNGGGGVNSAGGTGPSRQSNGTNAPQWNGSASSNNAPTTNGHNSGSNNNNNNNNSSSSSRNHYSSGPSSTAAPTSSSSDAFFPSSSTSSLSHRTQQSQSTPSTSATTLPSATLASAAPPKSQPLYGIVQYDFVAERADELDAKRGEPIIVIAQSNHEWFVAKPIGRLGGPGLIPVAFVEIQDMTTGKPVENVEELIRSAVVPKVEEWKKMTADYKSASISLGRFDTTAQPVTSNRTSNSAAPTNYQQQSQPQSQNQQTSSHYDKPADVDSRSNNNEYASVYDNAGQQSEDTRQYAEENDESNNRYSYARERMRYGLVTAASVESFHQEDGSFWFHLRAYFSTGASLVLYRLYQDFYDFQIALMDEFPVEAGRVPPTNRILPMMPGPTDHEDEGVCAQRVHDLSLYLSDLCSLPDRIRMSGLMYEFLVPRAGDVEVEVGNGQGANGDRGATSIEGQYGELVEYLDSMEGGGGHRTGAQSDLSTEVSNLRIDDRRENEYSSSSRQYSPTNEGQSSLIRFYYCSRDIVY